MVKTLLGILINLGDQVFLIEAYQGRSTHKVTFEVFLATEDLRNV